MPNFIFIRSDRTVFFILKLFLFSSFLTLLGCGGGGGSSEATADPVEYSITAASSGNGAISPARVNYTTGQAIAFTLTPNEGYRVDSVTGCDGTLNNNTYVTSSISGNCEVSASFVLDLFQVSAMAGEHGRFNVTSLMVRGSARLTLTPDPGFIVDQVSGCEGQLEGLIYTTGIITADCTVSASFKRGSTLVLEIGATKAFNFSWIDTPGVSHYKLFEDPDGQSGFSQVGDDISSGIESYEHIVALYSRMNAVYQLQICIEEECIDSNTVAVSGNLTEAIGYIKASNSNSGDRFGQGVKLSADGTTLAVATLWEESNATGINGNENDNSLNQTGAVYVFTKLGSLWSQQAYIKASNTDDWDAFGYSMDLSSDGSFLAVGAPGEDSVTTSINGDEDNNSGGRVGAAYIFTRSSGVWSQQAYIKASVAPPTGHQLSFGIEVALDASGSTLAVGSEWGVSGDNASGLVNIYIRNDIDWSEQQVLSASNADHSDGFGLALAISDDGATLAVGAPNEDSSARGINGDQTDNSMDHAGAVYIFSRINNIWSQQAYIKASNTDEGDYFGKELSLSGNGAMLAVGVPREDSSSDFSQFSNGLSWSGATYVYQLENDIWSQFDFIKASNAEQSDQFGGATSFNFDGSLLVVSATVEDGRSSGLGGDSQSGGELHSGAVYMFKKEGNNYNQINYIKAKYTRDLISFGSAVDLSADGETLAVGAAGESSVATGVGGDHLNTGSQYSGAVFLY